MAATVLAALVGIGTIMCARIVPLKTVPVDHHNEEEHHGQAMKLEPPSRPDSIPMGHPEAFIKTRTMAQREEDEPDPTQGEPEYHFWAL